MPSTSPTTHTRHHLGDGEMREARRGEARRGVRIDYLSCLLEVAVFRKPDAASEQL
jgi:hypothetical protein